MIIPAITLWQPWASWIAEGWKTMETRGHARFYCLAGKRIAIHAGKRWDPQAIMIASRWLTPDQVYLTNAFRDVLGAVVCTARVQDVRPLYVRHSPQALCDCAGDCLHGLFLSDVRSLIQPIPATGGQGIWHWDAPQGVLDVA